MFISKRIVRGKIQYYLDYSLTLDSYKKRYAQYIGAELDEKKILEKYNKLITKIVLDRTKYIVKNYKSILTNSEIYRLEEIRTKLDILKKILPNTYKSYKEDEFIKYAQGTSAVEGNTINIQEAKKF